MSQEVVLIAIVVAICLVIGFVAALLGRRSGRRAISQRLASLGTRLGLDPPEDEYNVETSLAYLEQVTGGAAQAVTESSSDAIRLRRSLDTLTQGVVLCDENGAVIYRNGRANALMVSRHGDALAAQAVTDVLEDAWHEGSAERTLDLYGPPRRTLQVRARQIDDGRRPLGVIALIEDVSERRRLEEIRRDFVANVSHELKTPMGALGLLAETLVSEPDPDVAQRLAGRIHNEAFRVSRIIDDLLDLSRIESEEAPPREPVLVNLVMADAIERVRATADQRGIEIVLHEPSPPVAVLGDRRQLVSAMHALLENAITYSYDNSKVVVTGAVQRFHAKLSHPSAAGAGNGAGDGSGADPTTGELPAVSADSASGAEAGNEAAAPEEAPVEPVFTPEILDQYSPLGQSAPGASAATGTTAPTMPVPPVITAEGEVTGTAPTDPSAANAPNWRIEERDNVRLSVQDHGVGIPARDLDRIFERFYRVDHGRSRDTGGTGLGLSIVRHVANNHQGWVDVESREGEGSTFTLVLPVQAERVRASKSATGKTAKKGGRPAPGDGPVNVLLAEDEESFIEALMIGLTNEGFRVTVARDGNEALQLFDETVPDILLLDLMLPKVSGIDVCRAIRTRSQVPIIMVTAKGTEIDTVVALEVGADDYVTKPYRMRELVARMRAVLRRAPGGSEARDMANSIDLGSDGIWESNGIKVDFDQRRVFVRGEEVHLRRKEFELLRLLVENSGRVLTRDVLIDRVWGTDYIGDTKTLDVHIKRLRSRIEADPSTPILISTVRGVGYRFAAA